MSAQRRALEAVHRSPRMASQRRAIAQLRGSSAVVQLASAAEVQAAVDRYWVIRGEINGLVKTEGRAAPDEALARALDDLKTLAEQVAADRDHEVHRSAYGGIYEFVDGLYDKVKAAGFVTEPLYEKMAAIQQLMRDKSLPIYADFERVKAEREHPVHYVKSLRKIDPDGATLRSVLAQAAYMSGDMFGVSAALRLDPRLGVAIFYDHRANRDREIEEKLLDFYTTKGGGRHPRVALIPVTDSARAYKSAMAGDFDDPQLFPHGRPAILSAVGACSAIGTATRIVAENYGANAARSRAAIEDEWLPAGAKEGTATGPESDVTIAQWVQAKGLRKGPSYAFIWFRKSGAKGGAHKELDTSLTATQQIVETCTRGQAADRFVLIGDKEPDLQAIPNAIDLTEFWNDPGSPFKGSGRSMQLALFSYLVHAGFNIMNLGMRSGALEGPALLGVKTVFLEERYNFQEGRMDQWQGTVPGFSRVELEHAPTEAGKIELARLVTVTLDSSNRSYGDAIAQIRALMPTHGSMIKEEIEGFAKRGVNVDKGLYNPDPVETVLRAVCAACESARKSKFEALCGGQKAKVLAEMRKAIRAYHDWAKATVKQGLIARYKGPVEGLSKGDQAKLDDVVSTTVGGWTKK